MEQLSSQCQIETWQGAEGVFLLASHGAAASAGQQHHPLGHARGLHRHSVSITRWAMHVGFIDTEYRVSMTGCLKHVYANIH